MLDPPAASRKPHNSFTSDLNSIIMRSSKNASSEAGITNPADTNHAFCCDEPVEYTLSMLLGTKGTKLYHIAGRTALLPK